MTKAEGWYIIYHAFGDMAQLVERYVRNVRARGIAPFLLEKTDVDVEA